MWLTRSAAGFSFCRHVSVVGYYLAFFLSLNNILFACLFFLDTLLSKLLGDLKKTRQAAYADGTHKNHKTQWRAYLYFCFSFNLKPLPATLDTVCLYCQFLSRSMTPLSIRNYLSGVKLLHVFTGFEFPFYDAPELKLTLRGLDRLLKHAPSCAPSVTARVN